MYFHCVDEIAALSRHAFSIPKTAARVRGIADEQTQPDLVQEVFARAFAPRARDAYDGIRPYRAYLRRIAKNLLIDRVRAAGHTVPLDDDDDLASEPETVEADVEAAEWRHRPACRPPTLI